MLPSSLHKDEDDSVVMPPQSAFGNYGNSVQYPSKPKSVPATTTTPNYGWPAHYLPPTPHQQLWNGPSVGWANTNPTTASNVTLSHPPTTSIPTSTGNPNGYYANGWVENSPYSNGYSLPLHNSSHTPAHPITSSHMTGTSFGYVGDNSSKLYYKFAPPTNNNNVE